MAASEIAPAVFGLVGALVGGGVTLVANWLTIINQRKVAESTRSYALRDRQYAAHVTYLAVMDDVMANCRVVLRLDSGDDDDEIQKHREMVENLSLKLPVPRSAAQLAGPPEIMPIMHEFYMGAIKLVDYMEKFYKMPADEQQEQALIRGAQLWAEARDKRGAYVAAAQAALN